MDAGDELSAEFQTFVNQRAGPVFGYPAGKLPTQSWVLLFNAGREDEGLYTLQGQQRGTYVLAFENQDEASRFAMLLQADGFDEPAPTAWQKDQLSEFCAMAEFGLSFVPSDALLVPPEKNYYDAEAFARLEEDEAACAETQALRERLERLIDGTD
jgi:hypothetical protein